MKIKQFIIISVVALLGVACFEEFDDPTQSIVKKTEIIAITLDPPEALPGDTVTATVHVADGLGRIDILPAMWMIDGAMSDEPLMGHQVTFTVPEMAPQAYDENGRAPLLVSVAVAKQSDFLETVDISDLENILENDDVLFGARTLSVTQAAVRNGNPKVRAIRLNREAGGEMPVTYALSAASTIGTDRALALQNAISVYEDEEIEIEITAKAALKTVELTYQWISTGGDFKGRRAAVEPWIAPEYIQPAPGSIVDPATPKVREDPNLYPIWVVVRDDGEPHQLGQTVVEFYLRVLPAVPAP